MTYEDKITIRHTDFPPVAWCSKCLILGYDPDKTEEIALYVSRSEDITKREVSK